MTSIPYAPGLELGQIVVQKRIDQLMEIAEIQKPLDRANDKFNSMALMVYKYSAILDQMVAMGVEGEGLMELKNEMQAVKKEMALSAFDLVKQTMITEQKKFNLKMKHAQTAISISVESPVDFANSPVIKFQSSFNTFKFDIQFVRNEMNDQSSSTHASNVTTKLHASARAVDPTSPDGPTMYSGSLSVGVSKLANQAETAEYHDVDSTIIITASATHAQADILDPLILHPVKALDCWNAMFPEDQLKTDPQSVLKAALGGEDEKGGSEQDKNKDNAITLISGCTKGSSFIGYVHIFKSEKTTSFQSSESLAASLSQSISRQSFISALGVSSSFSDTASETTKNLLSSSQVSNSCSFVITGCCPSIESNTVETTVKTLQPSAEEVMKQLGAIAAETSGKVKPEPERSLLGDMINLATGKKGGQHIAMNNEYLTNVVSALGEHDKRQNQVIDINSMWTAFTDYIAQCKQGDIGVPINFFLKRVDKPAVAKNYIRTFYPNGATGEDAARGAFGVAPKEADQ